MTEHLALSLILPAYNEARRLPPFLAAAREYLDGRYPADYEVIVVDDGSTDGTAALVEGLQDQWVDFRVVRHHQNSGKGAAVRSGMLAGHGELLLFADADGATPIEEEQRLRGLIQNGADVAIGSRLLADAATQRSRSWLRGLAGRSFAITARRLLRLSVRDTQCGFKMFRRKAGRHLFTLAKEQRFLFDLEVLALAQRFGYRVAEVPVRWTEVAGGHLSLAREFPRVLLDLWSLRQRLKREANALAPDPRKQKL